MTDVEVKNVKTPTKRKNPVQDKKNSAKKAKPQANSPQKAVSPKQFNKNKKDNSQNSGQKSNKNADKNKQAKGNSPKKLKAFSGTKAVAEETKKIGKKEDGTTTKEKKQRKSQFHTLELKLKSNKEEAIKSIENKIKAIESRTELTKTAKRKIKLLKRLQKIAAGQPLNQTTQQKAPHSKSDSTKRRERKKNAIKLASQPSLEKKDSGVVAEQPNGAKSNGKVVQNKKGQNKKNTKKQVPQKQIEEDSDANESDEEEELEGEEEEEASDDAVADEEESDVEEEEDESDEEENEDDDESDDDSEEDSPPVKVPKLSPNNKIHSNEENKIGLEQLKKNNLVVQNQKRFVLFVGNIPYDTNKTDLIEHFKKSGDIKHVRIPTEKKTSKPRGFAYLELSNEESYQKCLSMHHTFLKGRRINVLYTQGGKKKGEDQKKEIKAKNFKLHGMRKQGKLLGSKKENQKRSFRRAKQKVKTED